MNEERFSEIENLKPKVVQKMIRCPCGSSLPIEPLIQCVDPHCGVLQHMSCVIVPEESSGETGPALWRHYCEICRLNRADPFRATVTHLLSPAKLMTLSIPHDGSNPVQNVEKTFQLSKTDKNFLRHNDYNVQAWCILLNDKVRFRMQWPLYADLKVNGVPVRTVTRPGSQLLGANGRDDGPMIAFYMIDGLNRISLSGWDARSFCLGIRIVKENTVQQILDLILNEQTSDTFEDALARVQRCIGGGMAMAPEDSDSDLEVVSDFVTVNLRCPMGGYRIKTAGRFRPCAHMGCFDVETFVQLNQRSRKWQCPICLKNYSLEDITVDPYFNRITKMMEDCEEDVTEIDVKFDGSWRVKKGGGFENLDQWRLPDGCACYSTNETISSPVASMQIKGEGVIGHTDDRKLSKLGEIQTMSRQQEQFGSYGVTSINCSSFESLGDGEHNVDQNAASVSDLDIIVLSDSDEEAPSLMCTKPISKPKAVDDVGHAYSAPRILNPVIESLPCDVGLSSSLGTYGCKGNDFLTSQQTFASWAGSEFQPLSTRDILDASVDPEYPTVTSPSPICGRVLTSNCKANHGREFIGSFGSSPCQSNNLDSSRGCDLNPSQSSSQKSPCTLLQSQICHSRQISNGTNRENLSLDGVDESARDHRKVLISGGENFVKRDDFDEALSVNKKVKSELTMDTEQSNNPFSFPRRARSARQHSLPDN